jgi:3-oxoacyl-[acyl-carrier protein] reductase
MSRLKGKVAVVTGASKGIGAGIAERYGAEGAKVVVNYSSDKAGADKVVAKVKAAGGEAIAVQAETKKAFGTVDILVNNAGVYELKPLEEIDEKHFNRMFDLNVLGLLYATQGAAKAMNGSGSIINVSSVVSKTPAPGGSVYSATKGAVDVITRTLALELGPRKIRVNSLSPGFTVTEGVKSSGLEDAFSELAITRTPLGRVGQPEDIAKTAVFLASEDSGWITGETILVGGGLRL